jgi:hypothetical protein
MPLRYRPDAFREADVVTGTGKLAVLYERDAYSFQNEVTGRQSAGIAPSPRTGTRNRGLERPRHLAGRRPQRRAYLDRALEDGALPRERPQWPVRGRRIT